MPDIISASSQNKKMIIVTIALFVVLSLSSYYLFFRSSDSGSLEKLFGVDTRVIHLYDIPDIYAKQYLFTEQKYIELKSFSTLPLMVGNMGRENPFLPYEEQEAERESVPLAKEVFQEIFEEQKAADELPQQPETIDTAEPLLLPLKYGEK